jgi:hypothetical protein
MRRPSAETTAEWSRLLIAAQSGEPASFARLLEGATPYLRRVARRRLHRAREAERAVQQALITIHRLRRSYDPALPIAAWLASIVEAVMTAPDPSATPADGGAVRLPPRLARTSGRDHATA